MELERLVWAATEGELQAEEQGGEEAMAIEDEGWLRGRNNAAAGADEEEEEEEGKLVRAAWEATAGWAVIP